MANCQTSPHRFMGIQCEFASAPPQYLARAYHLARPPVSLSYTKPAAVFVDCSGRYGAPDGCGCSDVAIGSGRHRVHFTKFGRYHHEEIFADSRTVADNDARRLRHDEQHKAELKLGGQS